MLEITNSEVLADHTIPDPVCVILYTASFEGTPLIFKAECYTTDIFINCAIYLN